MADDVSETGDVLDIAVIGAGPCGLSVGVAARRAGLTCVIFDKGCITRCIAGYPTYGSFFSTAEKLELGDVPFTISGEKPTRREALRYYRRIVGHFELDVRQYEEVTEVTREGGELRLRTQRKDGDVGVFRARNVVVATGYYDSPNLLGVPGEDLPNVTHYYAEASPYYDQRCMVVGAGNSAVEAALDLYRHGARVTLVHFLGDIDSGVKPWIVPDIRNRIEDGSIQARWRTRVTGITRGAVRLREEETGRQETVENDWVFAMTGYTPDPALLRSLGVEIEPETGIPSHDPATMETNVPGVFIAGVVAGGNRPDKIFIETGREHGGRIVDALAARR